MQKIKLEKSEAFSVLVKEYPKYFTHGEGRFLVAGKWDAEGFSVFSFGEDISIMYKEESDLFRALGQLMAEMRKRDGGEIKIRQVPPMNFRSVMIDVSRNAVIKPEYLKKILLKLSLLGINYVCLYTEDTYEVTGHPLIGYNRGRYSKAEIRDVSVFAKKIGITMFPCIQTLGHLEQILKFPAYYRFKDNDKVLNVKNPKIYAFVEQLIKNATEPYDTDLIHIGMDETHGLGLGKAFEHGKPVDPRKLYQAHTAKVINICRKLNLKPMMWGDMVLGMSGENRRSMSKAQWKLMPKDVEMVYWDYYREEKKTYEKNIKTYRKFGYEPMIAAAVWNWHALWGRYGKTEKTLPLLMEVSKKYGIKRAMTTMWGDDGSEAPFDSNWPALVLYAEHCYCAAAKPGIMRELVKAVTGDDREKYLLPNALMNIPPAGYSYASDSAKGFLFDDPMFGVYASQVLAWKFKGNIKAHYEKIYKNIKAFMPGVSKENKLLFSYVLALAGVLRVKAGFRNELYLAYKKGNRKALRKLLKVLPALKKDYETLCKAHRAIWLLERKPQGLEVLDMRYGAQQKRLEITAERIKAYLAGKIEKIEELEEKPEKIFEKFPYSSLPLYRNYAVLTTVN